MSRLRFCDKLFAETTYRPDPVYSTMLCLRHLRGTLSTRLYPMRSPKMPSTAGETVMKGCFKSSMLVRDVVLWPLACQLV